jgi:hypothetical protein
MALSSNVIGKESGTPPFLQRSEVEAPASAGAPDRKVRKQHHGQR